MKTCSSFQDRRGFSLVELMVVIAVIGIIAAIAIPTLGNIKSKSDTASAKRHAQLIVKTHAEALQAGVIFSGDTVTKRVQELVDGKSGVGEHDDKEFNLDTLKPKEIERASEHIVWDAKNSLFIYYPRTGKK